MHARCLPSGVNITLYKNANDELYLEVPCESGAGQAPQVLCMAPSAVRDACACPAPAASNQTNVDVTTGDIPWGTNIIHVSRTCT